MMGFFKRVLEATEIHRVRRRARLDPSPRTTVQLCRRLQALGRVRSARDVAREGLLRFPSSAELREILHSTWRRSGRKKADELRERIRREGSVEAHVALIDYLLEYGETEGASTACIEMLKRHPDDARAALHGGRVLLSRFHKDHVAADGSMGLKSLLRATELDPANFHAHLALAETYYYIGAISKALFHLYKAMDIKPENDEVRRLYEVLVKLPLEKKEETELLREIEENDEAHFRYVPTTERDPTDPAVSGRIVMDIEQLSLLLGVRRVVLSHRGLDVVAQGGHRMQEDGEEQRSLLDLAKGFRRTASLSAKRMGIGAFEEAEMTWEGRSILAFAAGRSILLVETERAGRIPTIASEARHILAGCAVPEREAAHA